MQKIRFGMIHADYISMSDAIEVIISLAESRQGGYVVTPNVDHVVLAEKNKELQSVYTDATLSLIDGMPLVWVSKLVGFPLPEKISGSDLVQPLLRKAAEKKLSFFFLGAAPGVGAKAAERLLLEIPGLNIVGTYAPPLGFEQDRSAEDETLAKLISADPDIVLVALGCPKQELLMHRWYKQGITSVMIGVGASLDFISGKVKRAPRWMSATGLEWVFRIIQDPKRLIKRYLIQDMAILGILLKMTGIPKERWIFGTQDYSKKNAHDDFPGEY
jgi:N-acetylglucosaminyldiphosphoundecaprenol N-acetyl-beta-D-mannosaminyltransferase